MKVLIIGGGGREHAIADAFRRSPQNPQIILSPGNDGIALDYHCVRLSDHQAVLDYAKSEKVDLVFIGPEQPIAEGLSDLLRKHGIRVLAPSQAAGRLESSKAFAKKIMQKYHVPTAGYQMIQSQEQVTELLAKFSYPVVLKADGLAAGKGVIICADFDEAVSACDQLFAHSAGKTGILAEEFLQGWEVSLFAFTDGVSYQTSLFSQDHKQLYDGDRGPNTGGMGAICPVPEAEAWRERIEDEILKPILKAMRAMGSPYEGVLYLGLMITREGPKLIEFNCRFGDPETQAVLPLLKTDFVSLCDAIVERHVSELDLHWDHRSSVAVILAAPGYPGSYEKGIPIQIPQLESKVFYAGVSQSDEGLVTSGGRVIALQSVADSISEARSAVYRDVDAISFANKVYRKDIGLRDNHLA